MSNPDQVSRFSSGDDLAAFIESHRRQLLSYVDRNIGPALKSRLEPDDIVQEVIISALSAPEQFNAAGRDPFRLLCQLAEQRIIDAHRHHVGAKKTQCRPRSIYGCAGRRQRWFWIRRSARGQHHVAQSGVFARSKGISFATGHRRIERRAKRNPSSAICGRFAHEGHRRPNGKIGRRDSGDADSHRRSAAGSAYRRWLRTSQMENIVGAKQKDPASEVCRRVSAKTNGHDGLDTWTRLTGSFPAASVSCRLR